CELYVPDRSSLKESLLRKKESKRWMQLLIFNLIFAGPALVIAMLADFIPPLGDMLRVPIAEGFNLKVLDLIMFILATPVQFIGGMMIHFDHINNLGYPFYKIAFKNLRYLRAEMNTLIALATTEAY